MCLVQCVTTCVKLISYVINELMASTVSAFHLFVSLVADIEVDDYHIFTGDDLPLVIVLVQSTMCRFLTNCVLPNCSSMRRSPVSHRFGVIFSDSWQQEHSQDFV